MDFVVCPGHAFIHTVMSGCPMLISKIAIQNFRSVKTAEFSPSVFNVFVGQNNHGKTNIFEALSWFYDGGGSGKLNSFGQTGDEYSVEVELSGVQAGLELMKNEKNKTSLKKMFPEADTMRIIRRSTDRFGPYRIAGSIQR